MIRRVTRYLWSHFLKEFSSRHILLIAIEMALTLAAMHKVSTVTAVVHAVAVIFAAKVEVVTVVLPELVLSSVAGVQPVESIAVIDIIGQAPVFILWMPALDQSVAVVPLLLLVACMTVLNCCIVLVLGLETQAFVVD